MYNRVSYVYFFVLLIYGFGTALVKYLKCNIIFIYDSIKFLQIPKMFIPSNYIIFCTSAPVTKSKLLILFSVKYTILQIKTMVLNTRLKYSHVNLPSQPGRSFRGVPQISNSQLLQLCIIGILMYTYLF